MHSRLRHTHHAASRWIQTKNEWTMTLLTADDTTTTSRTTRCLESLTRPNTTSSVDVLDCYS
jgi:hypothetical protein